MLPTATAVPTPTPTRAQDLALIAEPVKSGLSHGAEGLLLFDLCLEIDWELGGLTDGDWGTTLERWSDHVEGIDATVLAMCEEELQSDDAGP